MFIKRMTEQELLETRVEPVTTAFGGWGFYTVR